MKEQLSNEELSRYERSLLVENFDEKAQIALKSASVLVVGAGGLGSAVLPYLTAAGVGKIGVCDFDIVSISNLQRQILYTADDLGKSKAEQASKRLALINSNVQIDVHNIKIDVDNVLTIASKYDIIIDCSDNYDVRYIVDNCCEQLKKVFIYGSAEGVGGQLSVFHYRGAGSYRDLYPNPPQTKQKVGVLSPLPGIIGSFQAMEAIKIITNIGTPLSGKLLTINTTTLQIQIFDI